MHEYACKYMNKSGNAMFLLTSSALSIYTALIDRIITNFNTL